MLVFWRKEKPRCIFHRLTQSVKLPHCFAETFLECWAAYETLLELLTNLNFQISPSKLVPPPLAAASVPGDSH